MTSKCVIPAQPKPTAQLVRSAADGLQMFVATIPKKADKPNAKSVVALVTVHSGIVTTEQLVAAFQRMFQCGWEWSASQFAPNSFLVKFPSSQKITEMNRYNNFGLYGLRAEVIVSQWSPENMAPHKLSSVWVTAGGVPDDLLNYFSFCIVGSLVGTVQAIDMETFRAKDVIRIRVGVMDHTKVPNMALLTVDPYIYRIRFELEQVIEIGGPMSGGILFPRAPDFGEGGGIL